MADEGPKICNCDKITPDLLHVLNSGLMCLGAEGYISESDENEIRKGVIEIANSCRYVYDDQAFEFVTPEELKRRQERRALIIKSLEDRNG